MLPSVVAPPTMPSSCVSPWCCVHPCQSPVPWTVLRHCRLPRDQGGAVCRLTLFDLARHLCLQGVTFSKMWSATCWRSLIVLTARSFFITLVCMLVCVNYVIILEHHCSGFNVSCSDCILPVAISEIYAVVNCVRLHC